MDNTKTLVVNWHLTEVCNFKCDFCYAKWGKEKTPDLFRDEKKALLLLDEIIILFNSIKKQGGFSKLRINFAGGEPLLYKKQLIKIIKETKKRGLETSIITNGYFIDLEFINKVGKSLDLLGISLDSENEDTNTQIGRISGNKMLNVPNLLASVNVIREINPSIEVKVNTVVNLLNWQEDLSSLIRNFSPNRWKLLRVLPIENTNLIINNEQFKHFIDTHNALKNIISIEDNSTMQNSYLMINPEGKFYQNGSSHTGYKYSSPILDVGIIKAFKQIDFDIHKFKTRYVPKNKIPIQMIE